MTAFDIQKIKEFMESIKKTQYTITCQYCQKDFQVPTNTNQKYCSIECSENENKTICQFCKVEFETIGPSICCSEKCSLNYMATKKIMKSKNPDTLKDVYIKYFGEIREGLDICYICGDNSNVKTLDKIKVCVRCQNRIKSNPTFWDLIITLCSSSSRIVPKTWGFEVHIVNHNLYCLKYLVFYKGCYFSNHVHIDKQETWHCIHGELEAILTNEQGYHKYVSLPKGSKIEIVPRMIHQVRAIEDSILVEVSTQSFVEDSYRHESFM